MPTAPAFDADSFLLTNAASRALYVEVARDLPINDFHNHLSPEEIATDRPFHNLAELWLEHDHYKWRAMRAAGIGEQFITGDAAPKEKFLAWAETVPLLLRNPLYDWNRLELWKFFGIDESLTPATATRIWDETSRQLRRHPLTPSQIFSQCRVASLGTTDDPADPLQWHERCRENKNLPRVSPTFRPDRALAIEQPASFVAWIGRLGAAANRSIESLDDLLAALAKRHLEFDQLGCRYSDHGLPRLFAANPDLSGAARIFLKVLASQTPDSSEVELWGATLMHWFAALDANRSWTKQLHLGPQRNNSTRLLQTVGHDAGADSIGDWPQVQRLQRYLNQLELDQCLPDHLVYVLNPGELYPVATMLGNFNSGPTPERNRRTRVRLGAAWWFFDHRAGIRTVLDGVSHTSLLAEFPGMVTDSRSFLSFARHDYYRRILCDLLGEEIEAGLIPESAARELLPKLC